MSRSVLSMSTALLIAGALHAQPPQPVPQPPNPQRVPPAASDATGQVQGQTRRAKQIIGARMTIQGGISIGTVDDLIIDDDGYIDYVVVNNQGRRVLVPWQAARFDFDQHTAVVNITQERFREVPVITGTTYPNVYEPAYMTKIYSYYNVPVPERKHAERRDERRDRRR